MPYNSRWQQFFVKTLTIHFFSEKHRKHDHQTMIMVWIIKKLGNQTLIMVRIFENMVVMPWIITTMPGNMAPCRHHGMNMTMFRHDHGMIMAWEPYFSNQVILPWLRLFISLIVYDTPVMSACLLVLMCSWNRQITFFVWNVSSNLIIRTEFMKCVVLFGYVLKSGSNPHAFPTFRTLHDTSSISSRWRSFWTNCQFNLWKNNIINFGQNCALDPIFNRVNSVTHFLSILPLKQLANVWTFAVFS